MRFRRRRRSQFTRLDFTSNEARDALCRITERRTNDLVAAVAIVPAMNATPIVDRMTGRPYIPSRGSFFSKRLGE